MKKALSFTLLTTALACKMAPPDDTGLDNCQAICGSELVIELAEESASFQVLFYAEEFNSLNLACPDGIRAGGPAQVEATCEEGGVTLTAHDYLFPAELMIAVDGGDEQTVVPDYEASELCGSSCNSAVVTL